MAIEWAVVQQEHVKEACRRYDAGEERPRHPARNTFILLESKRYPAKFIRGLAYEIATGHKLNPSVDFSGGVETVQFFKKLGYSTEYRGEISKSDRNFSKKRGLDAKKQKDALKKILERRFCHIKTEAKFDWLVVPDRSSMDDVFARMYEALVSFRGYKNFSTPGIRLQCDFFIPSKNLIIEYDERQHFTEPRVISLDFYPENGSFAFDIGYWKKECSKIKAKDPDKKYPYRDEQRAFYDSLRNILAACNGITLIRIKHGDYDWELESGKKIIDNLIGHRKAYTSNIDETIEHISCSLAKLQRRYREWAVQFSNYEEVIVWLTEKAVNTNKCRKQDTFNLLYSHWNCVTEKVLKIICPELIKEIQNSVAIALQNKNEAEIDQIWYLLYFLHPLRHELYYFDGHYPQGYSSRLAKLIRSHRQGFKGVHTYLNEKDRTFNDPFIKACATTAFKHVHLHPTTSMWETSLLKDISRTIKQIEIGEDNLSSDEQDVAIALSNMGKKGKTAKGWIDYAPCAINEGPIFILKGGKNHSDCFRGIVDILQCNNPKQRILRDKLKEYYIITK